MHTAQALLTTKKLADIVSASSKNHNKLYTYTAKNHKKLQLHTVTNPSTVFLYSSGYHTHHFSHSDTQVGMQFFQRSWAFSQCPAHNTYIYIRDKKINIYIYRDKWTKKLLRKKRFEYLQNQIGIVGWTPIIPSAGGQKRIPTRLSRPEKWWVWSSNKWVLLSEMKGLSHAK